MGYSLKGLFSRGYSQGLFSRAILKGYSQRLFSRAILKGYSEGLFSRAILNSLSSFLRRSLCMRGRCLQRLFFFLRRSF